MLFSYFSTKYKPLQSLYNILINAAEKLLPVSGIFSDKMNLFVSGRKKVFPTLENKISTEDKTIWFHAASLGEYEQAVPVIETVRNIFPGYKIVMSFFSPSGYEIKKNSVLVDVVVYLPLDTKRNAKRFLNLVHPEIALFIKYEFWPNFLKELRKREVRTLLVSGGFRKDQIFFKAYGSWMRSYLLTFNHFFVQNQESQKLLNTIGFKNVTISGDTRFDRVFKQLAQENILDFIADFKNDSLCIVAGSTWPEDEELLIDFINNAPQEIKFIIAPHTLKVSKIQQLRQNLKVKTILFSEKEGKNLASYQVFVIDTIGLLTKIYSYADIAYVGGAAGSTGLHNILEPAAFGIPVIIGENYSKFPEALQLKELGGLYSVKNNEELSTLLHNLISQEDFRLKTGHLAEKFIKSNTGATQQISNFLYNSKFSGKKNLKTMIFLLFLNNLAGNIIL